MQLKVCFHLPKASQVFIEGLFKSESIVIADKKSKSEFIVKSVVTQSSYLNEVNEEKEIVQILVKPDSPIVSGAKKDNGSYKFKSPDESGFVDSLIYSWREKIKTVYDELTGREAVLLIDVEMYDNPFRSRLVHIKADTPSQTKIRGFLNFKLRLTAENRFLDLLLNAGLGLYTAQGMGCLEVISNASSKNIKNN